MRKVSILILLIFVLLGAVISVFVILRLSQETAPDDSGAAVVCSRITFNEIPIPGTNQTVAPTEDMVISNQFQDLGYSFRTGPRFDGSACDRPFPFIAQQGDPFRSFGNNTLDQPDTPAPGQTFGPFWLTSQSWDGTEEQRDRPCSLEIVFQSDKKSNEFSFDILDLDYGERWVVEAFVNDGDTTPVASQSAIATNNANGDGRAFRIELTAPTAIGMIRIRPTILQKADGGSWGLGFDGFSAYCIEDVSSSSTVSTISSSDISTISSSTTTTISSSEESSSTTTTISSLSSISSVSSSVSSSTVSSSSSTITSSSTTTPVVSSSTSSLPPLPNTAAGDDERTLMLILLGGTLIVVGFLLTQFSSVGKFSSFLFAPSSGKKAFEKRVLDED